MRPEPRNSSYRDLVRRIPEGLRELNREKAARESESLKAEPRNAILMKCDFCDNEANVHLTDVSAGAKKEMHLCEECAHDHGTTIKSHEGRLTCIAANSGGSPAGPRRWTPAQYSRKK